MEVKYGACSKVRWEFFEGQRSMVIEMCGEQLKDRKRSTHLMFMLDLRETIDHLAMANSVHWYGHMLRREDSHVLRRVLYFEVEGQKKKAH